MIILLTLLLFTITVHTPIFAQEDVFKVLFIDGSVSVNGETGIKVGANLDFGDTIELGADGYIGLVHHTVKTMELKDRGKYPVEGLDKIIANEPVAPSRPAIHLLRYLTSGPGQLFNHRFEQTDESRFAAGWQADLGGIGASLTTDSYSGQYALKLWNWYHYVNTTVTNVDPFGGDTLSLSPRLGSPIDYIPDKLMGFYKYQTGEDLTEECGSALVKIVITGNSGKEILASGLGNFPVSDLYVPFEVSIEKHGLSGAPTRILVQFSTSGSCSFKTPKCCYLYLDELWLD